MIGVAAVALVAVTLLLLLRARAATVLAELRAARTQHMIVYRRSLGYAEHLKKNVLPFVGDKEDLEECDRELSAPRGSRDFTNAVRRFARKTCGSSGARASESGRLN